MSDKSNVSTLIIFVTFGIGAYFAYDAATAPTKDHPRPVPHSERTSKGHAQTAAPAQISRPPSNHATPNVDGDIQPKRQVETYDASPTNDEAPPPDELPMQPSLPEDPVEILYEIAEDTEEAPRAEDPSPPSDGLYNREPAPADYAPGEIEAGIYEGVCDDHGDCQPQGQGDGETVAPDMGPATGQEPTPDQSAAGDEAEYPATTPEYPATTPEYPATTSEYPATTPEYP